VKVNGERIEIFSGERDENGQRLEPEEQTAREVAITPMEVALGHGPRPEQREEILTTLPLQVNEDTTALELAERHMRRCELCEGFRRADWITLKKRLDDPSNREGHAFVNAIRGYLMGQVDTLNVQGTDHNVEHFLGLLGICGPVTEEDKEISIAQPDGTCSRFKPRDPSARRVASTVYDAVLRAASK
jgi:hypothetical protein